MEPLAPHRELQGNWEAPVCEMRGNAGQEPLLAGRVVAITGGSRGIGYATAKAVIRGGGRVGIQARRADVLKTASAALAEIDPRGGESVVAVVGDATQLGAAEGFLDAVVERFGHLDAFVAGAGVQRPVQLLRSTPEDWSTALRGNLVSSVMGCQAAVQRLSSGGAVIFIGSTAGARGSTVSIPYAVAKAGLSIVARSLAEELGSRGIRILCAVVGAVDTEMLHATYQAIGTPGRGRPRSLPVLRRQRRSGVLLTPRRSRRSSRFSFRSVPVTSRAATS